MPRFRAALCVLLAFAPWAGVRAAPRPAEPARAFERPEYLSIQKALARGWGTWDTRDPLAEVLLPEGLSVSLSLKGASRFDAYARPEMARERDGTQFRPGLHALDGSYAEADITWKGARVHLREATVGDDLVLLVAASGTPEAPLEAVVSLGMLWNRPGLLSRAPGELDAKLPSCSVRVFAAGREVADPYVPAGGPYLCLALEGEVGVSTGKPRDVAEIRALVDGARDRLERDAARHGELAEAYEAIRSSLGWSTIYDPGLGRVITPVSRDWNVGAGGYILFEWDTFFLAYAASLYGRELAYANFAEHLRARTDEGFIPNVEEENGMESFDRSQPPVGALVLRELYKKYGDRWLLESSFGDLLAWNRWWERRRMNGPLLGWGSDPAANPFHEREARTKVAAVWESGMDDSPMYDAVPYDAATGRLEIQDVGLNGLYVADCNALAEIAGVLGRTDEARELRSRAGRVGAALESLWDPATGLYLNRRTDTGERMARISPTLFYPLLGRVPDAARAADMVGRHLLNPAELGGDYLLASIARTDPAFPHQSYWRGAVWPPLNFLVYLGLRNYPLAQARAEIARKSMAIFLGEWRRKGFICENYSAITGTGDDRRLSSTPFYAWGVLMGMMGFIEAGEMPAPEAPILTPGSAGAGR